MITWVNRLVENSRTTASAASDNGHSLRAHNQTPPIVTPQNSFPLRLLLILRIFGVFSLCSVVLPLSVEADVLGMRQWTNQKNQKIKAKFIRITYKPEIKEKVHLVTFQLKSGKKTTLPMDSLSETDQNELMAWFKKNPMGAAPPTPPYKWPSQFHGSNSPKVVYVKFDTKRKAHLYRTEHFDFYIDKKLSQSTVSKCVAVFDTIVEALDSLPLQLNTIPAANKPRYEAILVGSRETYMQMGGIPNSGGFFSPGKNLTVIPFQSLGIVKKGKNWVFDGKQRSFGTLLHELTHHSTSHWRGMPPWFQEGLADYMQAMPYQSGRFLFTNPGSSISSSIREYKNYSVGGGVMPGGAFKMIHPEKLFATSRVTWNQTMSDKTASARNYASSCVLLYYLMHEDGRGDGEHLIAWLHSWRAAVLSRRGNEYGMLIKKHLLRDRSYQQLEEEISAAMKKKGLRIAFAN